MYIPMHGPWIIFLNNNKLNKMTLTPLNTFNTWHVGTSKMLCLRNHLNSGVPILFSPCLVYSKFIFIIWAVFYASRFFFVHFDKMYNRYVTAYGQTRKLGTGHNAQFSTLTVTYLHIYEWTQEHSVWDGLF